jgi:transcriptional regulator with XRE-family HTH domain
VDVSRKEPEGASIAEKTRGGILTRAKRRTRILELRAAGMTEEQIAEEVGMSRSAVTAVINKQLDQWMEDDRTNVERVRTMKLYELDQLKRAIWAKALKGDVRAVQTAAKIIGQQARIAGAEAPRETNNQPPINIFGMDPAEIDRMEKAWRETRPNIADEIIDAEVVENAHQPELPLFTNGSEGRGTGEDSESH